MLILAASHIMSRSPPAVLAVVVLRLPGKLALAPQRTAHPLQPPPPPHASACCTSPPARPALGQTHSGAGMWASSDNDNQHSLCATTRRLATAACTRTSRCRLTQVQQTGLISSSSHLDSAEPNKGCHPGWQVAGGRPSGGAGRMVRCTVSGWERWVQGWVWLIGEKRQHAGWQRQRRQQQQRQHRQWQWQRKQGQQQQ